MSTLYLDCAMGAAGDMLAAALADLLDDEAGFLKELNGMNIPGVSAELLPLSRRGIMGKSLHITVGGVAENEHSHHGQCMHDIESIVSSLNTTEDIKKNVLEIYDIIATAESRVHGVDVREVHFHEVGMLDAVADIAAVCLAMKKLSPDRVVASPVHVGSGQVKCAHGILPVLAPATAEILKGVPIYGGEIRGELCTPTGAALLKYFVSEFGNLPPLSVNDIGYGMGKREFDAVNCIRAIFGETNEDDDTVELRANIDDMTGEELSYVAEILRKESALDVWTENIGMKKSRPGVMLCVLCRACDSEKMSRIIFRHTTTIGVREIKCTRRTLTRHIEEVKTSLGTVRKKVSQGFGVTREKYEFSDLSRIAHENDMSISDVRKKLSEEE